MPPKYQDIIAEASAEKPKRSKYQDIIDEAGGQQPAAASDTLDIQDIPNAEDRNPDEFAAQFRNDVTELPKKKSKYQDIIDEASTPQQRQEISPSALSEEERTLPIARPARPQVKIEYDEQGQPILPDINAEARAREEERRKVVVTKPQKPFEERIPTTIQQPSATKAVPTNQVIGKQAVLPTQEVTAQAPTIEEQRKNRLTDAEIEQLKKKGAIPGQEKERPISEGYETPPAKQIGELYTSILNPTSGLFRGIEGLKNASDAYIRATKAPNPGQAAVRAATAMTQGAFALMEAYPYLRGFLGPTTVNIPLAGYVAAMKKMGFTGPNAQIYAVAEKLQEASKAMSLAKQAGAFKAFEVGEAVAPEVMQKVMSPVTTLTQPEKPLTKDLAAFADALVVLGLPILARRVKFGEPLKPQDRNAIFGKAKENPDVGAYAATHSGDAELVRRLLPERTTRFIAPEKGRAQEIKTQKMIAFETPAQKEARMAKSRENIQAPIRTQEMFEEEGKKAGVKFEGFQMLGGKSRPQFTDLEDTGSTFYVKPGESVTDALERHRKEWVEAGGTLKGKQEPVEPAEEKQIGLKDVDTEKGESYDKLWYETPAKNLDDEALRKAFNIVNSGLEQADKHTRPLYQARADELNAEITKRLMAPPKEVVDLDKVKPKPERKSKYADVDENTYPTLSQVAPKSIVPGYVIDRATGKVKMAGEYTDIPRELLDLSKKPTAQQLQLKGGRSEGNIDDLAKSAGHEDAESFRQALLKELEQFKVKGKKGVFTEIEPSEEEVAKYDEETQRQVQELKTTERQYKEKLVERFNNANTGAQIAYLKETKAASVPVSSLKQDDTLSVAGFKLKVNFTEDPQYPVELKGDYRLKLKGNEYIPVQHIYRGDEVITPEKLKRSMEQRNDIPFEPQAPYGEKAPDPYRWLKEKLGFLRQGGLTRKSFNEVAKVREILKGKSASDLLRGLNEIVKGNYNSGFIDEAQGYLNEYNEKFGLTKPEKGVTLPHEEESNIPARQLQTPTGEAGTTPLFGEEKPAGEKPSAEEQYLQEKLKAGENEPARQREATVRKERQTERLQEHVANLSKALNRQKQLRREMASGKQTPEQYANARQELTAINKRIGDLREKLAASEDPLFKSIVEPGFFKEGEKPYLPKGYTLINAGGPNPERKFLVIDKDYMTIGFGKTEAEAANRAMRVIKAMRDLKNDQPELDFKDETTIQTPGGKVQSARTAKVKIGGKDGLPLAARPLKPGEFEYDRRKYRVSKDWTGRLWGSNKTPQFVEDYASIMLPLEQAHVEHFFLSGESVDGKVHHLHVSQGIFNAAMVNPSLVLDFINRFRLKKIVATHNHPSGSMQASREDINVWNNLKEVIPEGVVLMNGIIIDREKGLYATFGEKEVVAYAKYIGHNEPNIPLTVYSYSRAELLAPISSMVQIFSPEDIAKFMTAERFSGTGKLHLMVLNQSGKMTAKWFLSKDFEYLLAHPLDVPAIGDEINVLIGRSGGISAILGGNRAILNNPVMALVLNRIVERVARAGFAIQDYVGLEPGATTYKNYGSAKEMGLINEPPQPYDAAEPIAPYNVKPTAVDKKLVNSPAFKKWFGKSKVVDENGKPIVVYHGTTRDFTTFTTTEANPESDFGSAIYFTNNPQDVSTNYAGIGPDLTNKIERHAERIQSEQDISIEEARKKAKQALTEHGGAVVPAYISMKNPFVVGGKKETFLDYRIIEKRGEIVDEKGMLVDFIENLRHEASKYNDGSVDGLIADILDESDYSDIRASKLDELMRKDEQFGYYTDDEGNLVSHEIYRAALERTGFDGVIDNSVDVKFGTQRRIGMPMKGMTPETVHYIAFSPEQIKSATGNRGTFNPNNPDITLEPNAPYGGKKLAPTFYSNTQKLIEQKMPNKASVEQVRNILKQGKQEEIKWTGLDDYLKTKPSFTKQEILDYLRTNEIKVEELELGSSIDTYRSDIEARFKDAGYKVYVDMSGEVDVLDKNDESVGAEELGIERPDLVVLADIYGQIQNQEFSKDDAIKMVTDDIEKLKERAEEAIQKNPELLRLREATEEAQRDNRMAVGLDETVQRRKNMEKLQKQLSAAYDANPDIKKIQDQHRDMLNVLHMLNDPQMKIPTSYERYVLPGGKKGTYREWLFMLPEMEIQNELPKGLSVTQNRSSVADKFGSQWIVVDGTGQRYAHGDTPEEAIKQYYVIHGQQYRSPHFNQPNIVAHARGDERTDANGKRTLFLEEMQSDWAAAAKRYGSGEGSVMHVPEAPFIKGEGWKKLVLRRMIRYAAENGFDSISWTTGQQQAERYNLRKYIDRIDFYKMNDGKIDFEAIDKNGREAIRKQVAPEELETYVGKEIAKKMVNEVESEDYKNRLDVKQTAKHLREKIDSLALSGYISAAERERAFHDIAAYESRMRGAVYPHWLENQPYNIPKPYRQVATLRGVDLEVGGEGLKNLYDRDFINIANDIGKKFGAKVGETKINEQPGWAVETPDGRRLTRLRVKSVAENLAKQQGGKVVEEKIDGETVHSLSITPQMKQSVLYEGQALFEPKADYFAGKERKDPIAPTKEQNDEYLRELLTEVGKLKRPFTAGVRRPQLISTLKQALPIYYMEAIARGMRRNEAVQYIRHKMIEQLYGGLSQEETLFGEKMKAARPKQIVGAATRLETETIDRWVKFYQKELRKAEGKEEADMRNMEIATDVADRILGGTLPPELVKNILNTAQRFRFNTDNQGRFFAGFKSRLANMAQSYGLGGGKLTNLMYEGDLVRGELFEVGNRLLSKIKDVYNNIENPFEKDRLSDSVIKALEDRDNAKRYLDTEQKKTVYDNAVKMLDYFKNRLKSEGYEVLEDYFTHIKQVDVLAQILELAGSEEKIAIGKLNDLINEKSPYLKPREDADIKIRKDLPGVLFQYLKSVSKEIAYRKGVQYYYENFLRDIPEALKRNSLERARNLMKASLNPQRGKGKLYRIANFIRSNQYRAFLGMNLKASAMNLTQVDFARLRWSKEAETLRKKLWHDRNNLSGPLADAVDVASADTPRFLELAATDEPIQQNNLTEQFNRIDTFQRTEGRNWGQAEMGSILNSVMNNPGYQQALKETGGDQLAAINRLLANKDVFDKAVREAAVTSAETQVAVAPSMRGEFYDAPLHRLQGMFTAFKFRQLQILSEALGKQEGINGTRAQLILRRGLSGEVTPVEVLREVESNRTALERMLEEAKRQKENIGIPYDDLQKYIDYLKNNEADLNATIRAMEPLTGSKARSIALVTKYYAKILGISIAFSLLWDTVDDAIYGDEDRDKNIVASMMKAAAFDIISLGTNPAKFLVSPVAPNLEHGYQYGRFSGRGLARDIVSYGINIIPFAGIAERATGKRISKVIVNAISPEKKREAGNPVTTPGKVKIAPSLK